MTQSRIYYEGSQPILRVENMETALRFYVGVLGFTNANWGTAEFTSVNRDRAGIYLCRGGQGRGGAWVWLGVDDVEVIYKDLKERGVPIRMAPTTIPGRWRCISRTQMATCSALDPSPSPKRLNSLHIFGVAP